MTTDSEETPAAENAQAKEGYGAGPMECDLPIESESTRLMLAVKGGDTHAFDDLVSRLRNRAYRVAHSLVGSHDDALELAQEAFLKTYRARGTFRDGEPFLPWFHRILRNTCFSFLRKHKRIAKHSLSGGRGRAGQDDDEGDWQLESELPAPTIDAEQEESNVALRTAFAQLSARDREILALRHFEELSYKEISAALDIPEGTVMSRLFHARRRLRDRLEPYLEGALLEYAEHAGHNHRGN